MYTDRREGRDVYILMEGRGEMYIYWWAGRDVC